MRVLRDAAIQALGTASWGQAIGLIDKAGDHPPIVAAAIIQARALIADGQADAALDMLAVTDVSEATGLELALYRMTQAAGLHMQSRPNELVAILDRLLGDDTTPIAVRAIANAWHSLIKSSQDLPLRPVARTLKSLATQHKADSLPYFAGISLNNAMCVELARGAYGEAISMGREALYQFASLANRTSELASLHSTLALSLAEAGDLDASWHEVDQALLASDPQTDALGECAWLAAVTGRADSRMVLLAAS